MTLTATPKPADGLASQLAYVTRVLHMPTIGRVWEELADHARRENWSHEEYLAAVLQRQLAERESAGTTMRIRTAHFPAVKTLEDFNLDHLPSLRRDLLAHLATGTFVPKAKAENVILLGPPGIGKTHLAIGLGVKAAQAGYSVLFDTANNWISRLTAAHHAGQLEAELKKIRRYKLVIIDEVGYIPFDQDAANLFFQLVASRYEQGSIMVTSNLPFGRWGETFSDDVVAAAMIDRLVHHAEVLTLTGDSYRTRARRELLAPRQPHRRIRGRRAGFQATTAARRAAGFTRTSTLPVRCSMLPRPRGSCRTSESAMPSRSSAAIAGSGCRYGRSQKGISAVVTPVRPSAFCRPRSACSASAIPCCLPAAPVPARAASIALPTSLAPRRRAKAEPNHLA
jgi:DNA replication protein DnaC